MMSASSEIERARRPIQAMSDINESGNQSGQQAAHSDATHPRKQWVRPELQRLALRETRSGAFPFPIEQFIDNPFTS